MQAILVMTNVANFEDAKTIARNLVTNKLCACVNISTKCHSIYSWQNKVEEAEEYTLSIKTTADKYTALEQQIRTMHQYELPEIIAIDISHGAADYLHWIESTTRAAE